MLDLSHSALSCSTPDPTVGKGIFESSSSERSDPQSWLAVPLAFIALLGSIAFIGQYRPSQVTRVLETVGPLAWVYWGCLAVSFLALALSFRSRIRSMPILAGAVFAFLVGHLVYRAWVGWMPWDMKMKIPMGQPQDVWPFVLHRIGYGLCVGGLIVATVAVVSRLRGISVSIPLAWGDWTVRSRAFTQKNQPESYYRSMVGFFFFALIFFLVGQAGAGFAPLRSGWLFQLFPVIVLAALINATIEEWIFRAGMQPAILAVAGVFRGLWIQGMLFGLMHWGNSVGIIAALPTSLLIGLGSVYWGKAVVETKGLGWVIVAHTLMDIAIMSVYFVPRTVAAA